MTKSRSKNLFAILFALSACEFSSPDLPLCGNGVIEQGEICDDGEKNSDNWGSAPRCNSSCSAIAPHCGDGILDSETEYCEHGELNDACYACNDDCSFCAEGSEYIESMVSIGGYSLYIACAGLGTPTTIMEAGLNNNHIDWFNIWPSVAQHTRVCIYDRAGTGQSENGPAPRTSEMIAEDLHALLQVANVSPPYLLVGHSLGGMHIRIYARMYPDQVYGMVLVDPTHEDIKSQLEEEMSPDDWTILQSVPPDNTENVDIEACYAQARASRHFGSRPLSVLTATGIPTYCPGDLNCVSSEGMATLIRVKTEKHAELAEMSTNNRHVLLDDSRHFVQTDRPDAIIKETLDVLNAARNGNDL